MTLAPLTVVPGGAAAGRLPEADDTSTATSAPKRLSMLTYHGPGA
ncbi:MAG: hypothetical protein ACE5E6_01215 [Phycisphaerae bacterium]